MTHPQQLLAALAVLLSITSHAAPTERRDTDSTEALRSVLAIRTNLLVPGMNIGLAVPIGNRLTVEGDFYSPWFGHDRKNSRCFELQGADIEVRWWFNPFVEGYRGNALKGHSLAVGALAGHYDFERDYKGFQGEFYGAYAGYAYSFHIRRYLRLQIGISLGWMRTSRKDYRVYTDYGKLIRTEPTNNNIRDWYGPVKASVTLSVPIDIQTLRKTHYGDENR